MINCGTEVQGCTNRRKHCRKYSDVLNCPWMQNIEYTSCRIYESLHTVCTYDKVLYSPYVYTVCTEEQRFNTAEGLAQWPRSSTPCQHQHSEPRCLLPVVVAGALCLLPPPFSSPPLSLFTSIHPSLPPLLSRSI